MKSLNSCGTRARGSWLPRRRVNSGLEELGVEIEVVDGARAPALALAELLGSGDVVDVDIILPSDVAALPYSSGTPVCRRASC